MKIVFKFCESGYFIKVLFENYSHGNFKFFILVFSHYTRFPIRKSIFLENLKVDNLFIKEISNSFKMLLFISKD